MRIIIITITPPRQPIASQLCRNDGSQLGHSSSFPFEPLPPVGGKREGGLMGEPTGEPTGEPAGEPLGEPAGAPVGEPAGRLAAP